MAAWMRSIDGYGGANGEHWKKAASVARKEDRITGERGTDGQEKVFYISCQNLRSSVERR